MLITTLPIFCPVSTCPLGLEDLVHLLVDGLDPAV